MSRVEKYVQASIEKIGGTDPSVNYLFNEIFYQYYEDLPFEEGGVPIVSILRRIKTRKEYLKIITGCDRRLDWPLNKILSHIPPPLHNIYFNNYFNATIRELAAQFFVEKFSSRELQIALSDRKLNCQRNELERIDRFLNGLKFAKAVVMVIELRDLSKHELKSPLNQIRKSEYDSAMNTIRKRITSFIERRNLSAKAFQRLSFDFRRSEFADISIEISFDGPYIKMYDESESLSRRLLNEFEKGFDRSLPYFRIYENFESNGTLVLIAIEKIF